MKHLTELEMMQLIEAIPSNKKSKNTTINQNILKHLYTCDRCLIDAWQIFDIKSDLLQDSNSKSLKTEIINTISLQFEKSKKLFDQISISDSILATLMRTPISVRNEQSNQKLLHETHYLASSKTLLGVIFQIQIISSNAGIELRIKGKQSKGLQRQDINSIYIKHKDSILEMQTFQENNFSSFLQPHLTEKQVWQIFAQTEDKVNHFILEIKLS